MKWRLLNLLYLTRPHRTQPLIKITMIYGLIKKRKWRTTSYPLKYCYTFFFKKWNSIVSNEYEIRTWLSSTAVGAGLQADDSGATLQLFGREGATVLLAGTRSQPRTGPFGMFVSLSDQSKTPPQRFGLAFFHTESFGCVAFIHSFSAKTW